MARHRCAGWLPSPRGDREEWSGVVMECFENEKNQLWVSNSDGDYNQVNYCPYCGFKAEEHVDKKGPQVVGVVGDW